MATCTCGEGRPGPSGNLRVRVELLQGTLDMLILKALSGGPLHGYGVARWLQFVTDGALLVEEGSLYPALHRLARKGQVQAEWGISEHNRRAKFYTLTPAGRQQLQAEARGWSDLSRVIARVMDAEPAPSGSG